MILKQQLSSGNSCSTNPYLFSVQLTIYEKTAHKFTVIIEQDEDGIYVAEVPQLRGCHTQAKDINTLIERIKEAIELYISDYDELAPMEFIGLQQIEVTV
ncbi:MAG: type II toxin-antitoxin system HicB family antitoxin [Methanogenium sp.]|nr:type II toxin-antitoxin system HicB family antitoxin [Methanogenium sp.]